MEHQAPESYHSNHGLKTEMWKRTGADALAAFKDNKAAENDKWNGEARPGYGPGPEYKDFAKQVREIPAQAVMDMVEMFPPEVATKPTGIDKAL